MQALVRFQCICLQRFWALRWSITVRGWPCRQGQTLSSANSCTDAGLVWCAWGYGLTGDQGLAEDLAQTALAKAYASWPRVRRAADPDAYLRRIMVNANRSTFRKRRVPEQLTGRPLDFGMADPTDRHDDRSALIAALLSLPPGQRAIVVLRYWMDMSETEVAAAQARRLFGGFERVLGFSHDRSRASQFTS